MIVTDANSRIYWHLEGLESRQVPIHLFFNPCILNMTQGRIMDNKVFGLFIQGRNNLAADFARYYYTIECPSYVVWGLGLGYHIHELFRLDDGIRIQVFESDLDSNSGLSSSAYPS